MPQGMEGAKAAHLMLREGFPDLKFTIDDLMIEGDKLVMVATGRGTNTGSFFGMPPSGKPVSWTGMRILRIKDGKFVSGVAEFDQVGILQQMGVIPSLAPPADLEANKAIIRRLYEEENKGNVDVVDELMAPDVVIHGDALAPLQKGTAGIKEQVKAVQERLRRADRHRRGPRRRRGQGHRPASLARPPDQGLHGHPRLQQGDHLDGDRRQPDRERQGRRALVHRQHVQPAAAARDHPGDGQ